MSFTACNAHLRCANQGIVRILLLPGANAPNVHKCTFAIYGEKNLKNDIYGMPGVKGQTLGDPGARPSTTDTVCLIWTKGQRSKSVPEPAPHLLLTICKIAGLVAQLSRSEWLAAPSVSGRSSV